MTTSVIQWATGPVGTAQLAAVIDDPALELVGVFVYAPDKVGVDAGTLAGRAPTDVLATNDRAAILELDADVVLHAASKVSGLAANTDDIVALLTSGKDVITVTSYNHLPSLDGHLDQRIAGACAQAGTRFHAAGEHPGFMFERLAVSLTGLSHRVDKITVQQFVDCTHVPERRMLVDLMGMGKAPDEISIKSPAFQSVSTQSEQALRAAADVLGLHIDTIGHVIETATVDHDVVVDCAVLPAGSVVGQILSWTAYHDDAPVLVAEEHWTCTSEIPDWGPMPDGHAVRVRLDGAPRMTLELSIDNEPVPEMANTPGGYVAVACSAVRAIPFVRQAPPGVVVPNVFGTYRWPS